MATNHADGLADLHSEFDQKVPGAATTFGQETGLPFDEKKQSIDIHSPTSSQAAGPTPDGGEPSDEEKATLRRIGENLPISAFLVAFVELCERFTYYGCQGLFQNYVSKPLDGSEGRGALGMGSQAATGLTTFFQFWCYVTPILGAIIADQYLGKYNTILLFAGVYIVGLLILWVTALPTSLEHGAGLGGFIAAILVIGLGTGGIKSNVAPLIADQYQRHVMAVHTIPKTGERVIIDPAITIQRIYMVFYGCINVGALSLLATPYMERDIGFWTAYLMGFCLFIVGVAVLLLGRKLYVVRPPQGGVITDAFKAIGMMIASRNMDAPKASWRAANGKSTAKVHWDDHFVDELKRALKACKVFTFYPVFWVAYGQFSSNFVTQAEQMAGHGIPNDLMQNFDPIAIIVFLPLLETFVYPALRRWRIPFLPVSRITLGFWVAALAMTYAAITQHYIYKAGPCYATPLCDASIVDGVAQGNNVHIAIQTPAYMLVGISEIFISVTGLEYAYTKAPPSMKSFVQSLYLLTNAFGSALAEALVPTAKDPEFLWLYAGIGIASATTGCIFYLTFRHYNALEEKLNDLDRDTTVLAPGASIAQRGSSVDHGANAHV